MKILLAEDENDLREVVAEYLENFGNTVTAVPDGQAALDKSRAAAFDIIVLDIMMPVMDGITALSKMREEGNITPVLMLTAKSELDDRVTGLNAGADDYLTKPFAMKELLARINALTRRRNVFERKLLTMSNVRLDVEHETMEATNSISLSTHETRMMNMLMNDPAKKFSLSQIKERVWTEDGEDASDTAIVEMYLSFLNSKLEAISAEIRLKRDEGGVWLQ